MQCATLTAIGECFQAVYHINGGVGPVQWNICRPRAAKMKHKMNIYIAGKITGLTEAEAFESFDLAAREIEKRGHEPLNPMRLVDQDPDRTYEDLLLNALEIVLVSAEAMYMLPNWRDSLGARIEHAIATEKKLPIYYAATEF